MPTVQSGWKKMRTEIVSFAPSAFWRSEFFIAIDLSVFRAPPYLAGFFHGNVTAHRYRLIGWGTMYDKF
jgi:hypothetical protein